MLKGTLSVGLTNSNHLTIFVASPWEFAFNGTTHSSLSQALAAAAEYLKVHSDGTMERAFANLSPVEVDKMVSSMREAGGHYARRLAEAWSYADSSNRKALAEAMQVMVAHYAPTLASQDAYEENMSVATTERITACRIFNAELNRLEISPNGDDYNALLDMICGGQATLPVASGR